MPRNTSGLKRGGAPGRRKGVPNRATREIKDMAQRLLSDKEYCAMLKRKLSRGDLPPAVWTVLYYYAYGRPVETVQIGAAETPLPPFIIKYDASDD